MITFHYTEIEDYGQGMMDEEYTFESKEELESFLKEYMERAWVIIGGSWVDYGDGKRHSLHVVVK